MFTMLVIVFTLIIIALVVIQALDNLMTIVAYAGILFLIQQWLF